MNERAPRCLRVAGAQIPVRNDIPENLAALTRAIDFARDARADILLTPEGSLSGYTPSFDPRAVEEGLAAVTAQASRARMGLALGTCFIEPDDGRCYDELRFISPSGENLGFHSKILTCGTLTDPPQGEINDYAVRPLRVFRYQGILVGGLVCNDMWASPGCTPAPDPHLTHQLARMGARIIFHAVNGGRDGSAWSELAWQYHEANLRMRARASRVWIVSVDNCFPLDLPCSAPSGVIDPDGNWAVKTEPRGEQYFVFSIPLPE
jgi:predicted amidohydrolase